MNFQTGPIYRQHQMRHVHFLLITGMEISWLKPYTEGHATIHAISFHKLKLCVPLLIRIQDKN